MVVVECTQLWLPCRSIKPKRRIISLLQTRSSHIHVVDLDLSLKVPPLQIANVKFV